MKRPLAKLLAHVGEKRSTFRGEARVVNAVIVTVAALIGSLLGMRAPDANYRAVYRSVGKILMQWGRER